MNQIGDATAAIFVPIDKKTATRLLAQCLPGESLSDVIARMSKRKNGKSAPEPILPSSRVHARKYKAIFLGETITADTLPELFARFVDLANEIDLATVERLADMKAQSRRYVSRKRGAIHPGRPDLPVMQTRSGWWISKNIGRDDVIRGLKALAEAGGLVFGTDIRFPAGSN